MRLEGYFDASTVLQPDRLLKVIAHVPHQLLCNRTLVCEVRLAIGDDCFQRRRRLPGYPVKDEGLFPPFHWDDECRSIRVLYLRRFL